MDTKETVKTLHRYFIWSDRMRIHFYDTLKQKSQEKSIDEFMYMSLWYGTFYVLIEGWMKLRLSDPQIDVLLQSPYVRKLKEYRNGIFHYHEKYINAKLKPILGTRTEMVQWITELREAFSNWFLIEMRKTG